MAYHFEDVFLVMIFGIIRLQVAIVTYFVTIKGPETVIKREIL